jgi:hypothetical protein
MANDTWPVHVGLVKHNHGTDVFVGWDEDALYAALYEYVSQWWDDFCDDEDIPADPKVAVERYFDRAIDTEYLDIVGASLPVR